MIAWCVGVGLAAPQEAAHSGPPPPAAAAPATTLYHPDPQHLWNRLHASLLIRTARDGTPYGTDSLDPLLWASTKHLLEGESHAQAIGMLDRFLESHGERLIDDPLKRAVLQRDLWAVFDWAATRNRFEQVAFHEAAVTALTTRLAKIIRRLALAREQIDALPDNYAAAVAAKVYPNAFDPDHPEAGFLPPDLFQPDGRWVCVASLQGLVAPVHTREFGGRSVFLIFISLPEGRTQTLEYLTRLNDFPEPWVYDLNRLGKVSGYALMPHSFDPKRPPWVNPAMPQFPPGTQFALVRQALLIDRAGNPVPTHLTESVQLRVYQEINCNRGDGGKQAFFEFALLRQELLAGQPGAFRALGKETKVFSSFFLSHGIDPFESQARDSDATSTDPREPALNCMGCHTGTGIHSVLSHSQLFTYPQPLQPPQYQSYEPEGLGKFTSEWKRDQFTWGLLKGLWTSEK